MDASDYLNLSIGIAEIVLAGLVLAQLRGYVRRYPWLGALMVFFIVRGGDRLYAAFAGGLPDRVGYAVDGAVLIVLVLLLTGIGRTVVAFRLAHDEARYREQEYARALRDYRVLARHRLANPLAAIRGGLATVRELREIDADQLDELLAMVDPEAARLEEIALDPLADRAEERALRPRPRI